MKHRTMIALLLGAIMGGWSAAAAEAPPAKPFKPYRSVANAPEITGKATGFFHFQKNPDGRWWIIDPEGKGYVSFGIDHCNYRGHYCYKLGYYPYRKNNDAKYCRPGEKDPNLVDPDLRTKEASLNPPVYTLRWGDETEKRLREWGFNALGSTCDEQFITRGFVARPLLRLTEAFGRRQENETDTYYIAKHLGRASTIFPNVFHPEFEQHCYDRAQELCAPNKDNPWYLGYYIDNELAWWGRAARTEPVGLFNLTMEKSPEHTAKQALVKFLADDFKQDVQAFNRVFGTKIAAFDDLYQLKKLPHETREQLNVKDRFLGLIAETYFRITTSAIRKADPNHLILGCRFADVTGAVSPLVWGAAGKYCDGISVNFYPTANLDDNCVYMGNTGTGESAADAFNRLYSYTGKPLLVTEWSFIGLDSGLPCTYGAGQRFYTQKERTQATELFAKTMLSAPNVVGYDYFMWCDEPELGITAAFLENSNYGLVNEKGEPYPEMTAMFTELHKHPVKYRLAPTPARKKIVHAPLPSAEKIAERLAGKDRSARATFTKDGDQFTLTNGKVTLSGAIGNVEIFSQILRGSEMHSSLELQVQELTESGASSWRKPRKLNAVQGKTMPDGSAWAHITLRGWSFQVVLKVILPADSEHFVTEVVSLQNVSKKNFHAKRIFVSLMPQKKWNSGEKLPPRIWKGPSFGCWYHADNTYQGSVSLIDANSRTIFYEQRGNAHPDSYLDLNANLKPNEMFKASPRRRGTMVHFFGNGNTQDAVKHATELTNKMR